MKKIILLLSTMQLLFANVSYEKLDYSVMQLEERTINQYEKQYFTIDVPDGSELTVKLVDLSADVDLYVTQGWIEPKLSSSYCKSTNGGTNEEECTVTAPNYKRHNIMVYGFRDATYKIVPAKNKENEAILLGNKAVKAHVKIDKHHTYRIDSKPGETVRVKLSELTADADLKLSMGHKVRKNSFSCKSTNGGTKVDECSVTIPTNKGYDDLVYVYVDVFGFRTADYKIERFKSGSSTGTNPCITRDQLKEKIRNNENIENVNTSCITNMSYLFYLTAKDNPDYNPDISGWDVSNVETMSHMFEYSNINPDISGWNVSKVKDMSGMFSHSGFNQDIGSWDVSNVESMKSMFRTKTSCLDFNQDISSWDVSNVKDMSGMFLQGCLGYDSENFKFRNHDLSGWNVSNVIKHEGFFGDTQASKFGNIEPNWN